MSEITLSNDKCEECGQFRLNIDGACSVDEQNQLINKVVARWMMHDALVEALQGFVDTANSYNWKEYPACRGDLFQKATKALELAKESEMIQTNKQGGNHHV